MVMYRCLPIVSGLTLDAGRLRTATIWSRIGGSCTRLSNLSSWEKNIGQSATRALMMQHCHNVQDAPSICVPKCMHEPHARRHVRSGDNIYTPGPTWKRRLLQRMRKRRSSMEIMKESSTRFRRNRSEFGRRRNAKELVWRIPMDSLTESNRRRRRNRSLSRGRRITVEPGDLRDGQEEQGHSSPGTGVPSFAGVVSSVIGHASPRRAREDRQTEAQAAAQHSLAQEPRQGELDEDVQILGSRSPRRSRIGGTELRNEVSTSENEEYPRRKKGNLDDEMSEAATSSQTPESCTICMEPLREAGDHRICCLACGHLFGLKCIEHWLRDYGKKKCPQCQSRARKEDIRVLYTPRVVVLAGRSVQETIALTNENAKLKEENSKLKKSLQNTKKKLSSMEATGEHARGKRLRSGAGGRLSPAGVHLQNSGVPESIGGERWSRHDFQITSNETIFCDLTRIIVNGSKAFDMDAYTQTLVFSDRTDGTGSASAFGLSKMNILDVRFTQKMNIRSDLGAIRDIRIGNRTHQGNLALVASMKKLSIISMESNSVVLNYEVPSPAWSCAWDPCNPNLLYSGLQNGSLLVFDIRQTAFPITTREGPEPPAPGILSRPIHSLQFVPDTTSMPYQASINSEAGPVGGNQILGASVLGVFSWNVNLALAENSVLRPTWIFAAAEKFCSSVVYDKSSETAVASLRPSPTLSLTPSVHSSRDGLSVSSQALSHGPVDTAVAAQHSTPRPTRADQVGVSLSAMCAPSEAALNRDSASHWMLRRHDVSRNTESNLGQQASSSSTGASAHWRWVGEMTGHRSQPMLSRGVVIPRSNRSSVFASGDNLACNLLLWDMNSSRIFQSFNPHESPVIDVRHIPLGDIDLIGSLSENSLRLYRKKRE